MGPQNQEYISQELAGVRFIYETLYPDLPVELHAWWEKARIPVPAVHEQTPAYGAELLALSYIGRQQIGPEATAAQPGKRALVAIPSPYQLAQRGGGDMPWRQRPWHYRLMHRLSPLLAEQAKYLIERRWLARRPVRHKFSRLPFSAGVLGVAAPAPADKPPAILIGLHWLDVGGAEKLGFDCIHWALEAGLRVIVVTGTEGAERQAHRLPQDPRVQLVRLSRYLPQGLHNAFIGRLIAQENIILTHNHHCVPLYDALPTIKLEHPHVVNLDSTHIVEYADGGYPRISGVWSNYLDHHHVISGELLNFYRQNFRVHGSKAVLGRLLDDAERSAEAAPVRIRDGQTRCRVVFIGRMVHQKRPVVVAAIIRRLLKWGRRNGVEFSFDLVGEGPYRAALEHLLTRWRIAGQVRLHGAGTDVPALLAKSDVLLLPSANEGLALVCYEAIAAGCVPVSSDVGAQNEICPPQTLVPWSPHGAVRETAAVVERLLREPGFAASVETAQRAKLDALRAEPSAREVVMKIYRQALAAAPGQPDPQPVRVAAGAAAETAGEVLAEDVV